MPRQVTQVEENIHKKSSYDKRKSDEYSLTFWTSVKLQPHCNVTVPAFRNNTEIQSFHGWRKPVASHGVTIAVSWEILQANESHDQKFYQ